MNYSVAQVRVPIPATFKMAITLGLEAALELHLTNGANLNARDEKGQTPLILAASRGHRAICSVLLSAGADPDLKDDAGHDALETAVRFQQSEVADLLTKFLSRRHAPADVPRSTDDDGEEFDLSGWQAEADPEPPPADPTVLSGVHELDALLSTRVPIDLDEDWSDVEIDLPELIVRRPQKIIEEEAPWLAAARQLMLVGLHEGIVTQQQLDAISPGAGPEGESDAAADRQPLFRIVLGDLGIRIVDDPDVPDPAADAEDESDDAPGLDEGMALLRSLMAPPNDPLHPYFRHLSRARLLTREEEGAVARDIEEGTRQSLVAIASSSATMAEVFRIVDAIEDGTLQWRDVLTEDPAYTEDVAQPASLEDDDEFPADTDEDAAAGTSPRLSSLLAQQLASLRSHFLELGHTGPGAAADRLSEILVRHLLALDFREPWFDRISLALTTSEPDAALRTAFAAGIARAPARPASVSSRPTRSSLSGSPAGTMRSRSAILFRKAPSVF
jgi:RNA polymerase primary sigma factor